MTLNGPSTTRVKNGNRPIAAATSNSQNKDSSFYLLTTQPLPLRHDGHPSRLNIGQMKGRRSMGTYLPLVGSPFQPLATTISFCGHGTTSRSAIICGVTPRELGSTEGLR